MPRHTAAWGERHFIRSDRKIAPPKSVYRFPVTRKCTYHQPLVHTQVHTKQDVVYTDLSIDYQRLTIKSAECRQNYKKHFLCCKHTPLQFIYTPTQASSPQLYFGLHLFVVGHTTPDACTYVARVTYQISTPVVNVAVPHNRRICKMYCCTLVPWVLY